MGADLPGNQVLSLAPHRFDEHAMAGSGGGGEQHPRLFAVDHGLDHYIHGAFFQAEALGIILHTLGVQGIHAPLDALQQMGTVHEQAGLVLAGVGGKGPVLVGGR